MPPHAIAEPYLAKQKLENDDMLRAQQLILLFIGGKPDKGSSARCEGSKTFIFEEEGKIK